MSESEPRRDERASPDPAEPSATSEIDAELDELEAALDAVDAALKALDADDLDAAEALTASLGDTNDVSPADPSLSTEG